MTKQELESLLEYLQTRKFSGTMTKQELESLLEYLQTRKFSGTMTKQELESLLEYLQTRKFSGTMTNEKLSPRPENNQKTRPPPVRTKVSPFNLVIFRPLQHLDFVSKQVGIWQQIQSILSASSVINHNTGRAGLYAGPLLSFL
ncbi:hypothetical protein RRG08_039851 [Elysia crispata]|uniref:Uncharacterized protein n=1 Tax=Elysia crispata TaxID=231223 RepID=A0AAE0ZWM9_9GAST|nr:hypothetical protein RRG08_039851 [Elysia crispata]